MTSKIVIVAAVCFLGYALARWGTSEKDGSRNIATQELKPWADNPYLGNSPGSMITVRGGAAKVSGDGTVGESVAEVQTRITTFASDPRSGNIVYGEQYGNGYRLCLLHRSDRSIRILFETQPLIHSASWSPDGTRLAFLVGDRESFVPIWRSWPDWKDQSLNLIGVGENQDACLVTNLGKIDLRGSHASEKMLNWDLMAPQIIWSADGKSLYWVAEDERITQQDLASGRRTSHGKAEHLYRVSDKGFIVARANPWRLVLLPVNHGHETEIVRFTDVDDVGVGLMVPDTAVLSLIVQRYEKDSIGMATKVFSISTLFIDIDARTALGKLSLPIHGYITKRY
jgi:hypothetical protein